MKHLKGGFIETKSNLLSGIILCTLDLTGQCEDGF